MSAKPQILLDVGGTVSFTVPEGTPSAGATCVLYDHAGASLGTPTVTISGSTLSAPVTGGEADYEAENYRIRWTYTVSATSYRTDTLFDVVRAILRAPCSETKLVSRFPILTSRYPRGQSSYTSHLADAWEEIVSTIRARGMRPSLVIDASAFEAAHAALAASRVAENFTPTAGQGDDWAAKAQQWRQWAEQDLERVFAAVWWYDRGSDLIPGATGDETDVNVGRIVALR